jgi:hypothetical protein
VQYWRVVALGASLSGCGSFGSNDSDPPASTPVEASSPVVEGGAPGDAALTQEAVVVVSRIHAPTYLSARAGSLFFADGTRDVFVCSPSTCSPSALSNGPAPKAAVAASTSAVLAIDTTCVNALRSDGIYLYGPDGGAVVVGDPCPTSVAATGDFTFVTSAGLQTLGTAWSVKRCTASMCEEIVGGSATTAPFGSPKVIAATGTDVYVGTASGRLVRWANQANAPGGTLLVESEFFRDLATDGTHLSWIDGTRVRACTIASCAGTVYTVAADATARHLAADASGLYWTSTGSGGADGKVLRVAPGGTTVTTIANGQTGPEGITLDDGFVYWTTRACDRCAPDQGAIVRRPKP